MHTQRTMHNAQCTNAGDRTRGPENLQSSTTELLPATVMMPSDDEDSDGDDD
jgi:hypothetical protein